MTTLAIDTAQPLVIPRIVLIVDDVEETGLMYECMLSGGDLYVSRSSLVEAFDYARELRPEAIVADLGVGPGYEEGVEFLSRVAADPELRDVPLIVITAAAPGAALLGAHQVLLKPAAPETLIACVEALFESREVRTRSQTLRRSVAAVVARAQPAMARPARVRDARAAAAASNKATPSKREPAD